MVWRRGAVHIMDAQEKKLRQSIWIVIGVGIFLTIALAVGLVTQVVNKQRVKITAAEATYKAQKTQADLLPTALADKQKAEDVQKYVTGQLAFFRQRYRSLPFAPLDAAQITTPNLPENMKTTQARSNRNVAWRRWMNEYANGYGPALQRELISAANESGVVLTTNVKVGDPPKAPEECIPPTNSLFRPTGGALPISIVGSMSNIMQFLNRVNQSSILMLVGNDLKMSGSSPSITATFSITPYLLATGEGAPVTAAGASAGTSDAAASGGASYPGSGGSSYPGSGSSGSGSSGSGSGSPSGSPAP